MYNVKITSPKYDWDENPILHTVEVLEFSTEVEAADYLESIRQAAQTARTPYAAGERYIRTESALYERV